MTILGIETSCDETSVALLETRGDYPALEYRVRAHLVHSQVDIHSRYGGVFPMMAKREHAKRLVPLLEKAIEESGIGTKAIEISNETLENVRKICGEHDEELFESIAKSSLVKEKLAIDRIAVTHGPGLEPALWVGINFANALAALWNVPAEGVNHMEGHIAASLIPSAKPSQGFQKLIDCPFPAIALLLSGGHTEIVLAEKIGSYRILGRTRDDAVGEAFDKVARMLGLSYPGGPEIAKFASEAKGASSIRLPRPMIDSDSLDMSFSGLKTAVLYELKKHPEISESLKKEIAVEFQDAVTDTIVAKLKKAFERNDAFALIAGGGVMANRRVREACADLATARGVPFLPPAEGLSGDNALMIALAAALRGGAGAPPVAAQGNLSFVV